MNFVWGHRTEIVFGPGKIAVLPEALKELGAKRALLVVGASAMKEAGVLDRVLHSLKGYEVKVHSGVKVNLPMEDCDHILESAREHEAEAVIGLGGGSVLDGAKAAALMALGGGATREYVEGKPVSAFLPYLAIPATAGTGSEVTSAMIFTDTEKKRKVSFSHRAGLARVAIVDPELTVSMPRDLTAFTGIDALSHGLEAYWSKLATPLSDLFALEAVTAVIRNLPAAFENPEDLEARGRMSYAALVGGLAIAQTATAALHGLTYPLTALFQVPHGAACAFLIRELMKINFHHLAPEKKVRLLHHVNANTIDAAIDGLSELISACDLPETLADLKVPEREIHRLAESASLPHLERNIAPLSREKILALWNQKRSR